jgi:hypothetical protein
MGESRIRSNIKRFSRSWDSGFDYDKARKDLDIPDGYVVVSMIAIGIRRPKESLPLGL